MTDKNNVFLFTGPSGVGKTYLANKLAHLTQGTQLVNLKLEDNPCIAPDTKIVLVDDVFNDGEVEKAVSLFMQKQVEIIVIIGQEKSDFKTNFLNHLHLSGKPGERVFKISRRGSFSEISESSVNSVMQLVH